jgi:hypothetical protein
MVAHKEPRIIKSSDFAEKTEFQLIFSVADNG